MEDTTAEWIPNQHGTIGTDVRKPRPTGRQLLAAIVIAFVFLAAAYFSYDATTEELPDLSYFGEVDPTSLPPVYFRDQPTQPQGAPEGPQIPYPEPRTLQ